MCVELPTQVRIDRERPSEMGSGLHVPHPASCCLSRSKMMWLWMSDAHSQFRISFAFALLSFISCGKNHTSWALPSTHRCIQTCWPWARVGQQSPRRPLFCGTERTWWAALSRAPARAAPILLSASVSSAALGTSSPWGLGICPSVNFCSFHSAWCPQVLPVLLPVTGFRPFKRPIADHCMR